jgi:hypothetical protein
MITKILLYFTSLKKSENIDKYLFNNTFFEAFLIIIYVNCHIPE